MPTPAEIKKALVQSGFEVYRTRGDVVHVAERVRENLIMDSGVRVEAATTRVLFVVRAQKNDFPGAAEEALFDRARQLASAALERGYAEVGTNVTHVKDPGGEERTIETLCEVVFEKKTADIGSAIDEVKFALGLEKSVPVGR